MTLEELRDSYDWAEVFGEGTGVNRDGTVAQCAPGSLVSTDPVHRADVVEIVASVDGENDGADWLGVFKLADGRYLVASGGCDYTGWDCRAGNSLTVCANMEEVLQFGLSAEERTRLGM